MRRPPPPPSCHGRSAPRARSASEERRLLLGGLREDDRLVQHIADLPEVGPERLHLARGLTTAVKHGRRVEGGDPGPPARREPLPADPADRDLLLQDEPRREVAESDDQPWLHELDLLVGPPGAGPAPVRGGAPGPGGAAPAPAGGFPPADSIARRVRARQPTWTRGTRASIVETIS